MFQKGIREYFETGIRDDFVRAGFDPAGTVGMAQVHIMSEEIIRLRKTQKTHMWNKQFFLPASIPTMQTVCGIRVTDKEVREEIVSIHSSWEHVTCGNCLEDLPPVNRRAEAIAATKAKYEEHG